MPIHCADCIDIFFGDLTVWNGNGFCGAVVSQIAEVDKLMSDIHQEASRVSQTVSALSI